MTINLVLLFVWICLVYGYTIDLSKTDRLFDGIGALSAGASSRLLIDYDEPYRSQILDYLFKPFFGAHLQMLKVEIGGDTFSTCGTEPSHMHIASDLNYKRGYEYFLMVEAKKRNPNIKLYGLSWGFPAWIGYGALNENMANYTLLWVEGCRKIYNLTIDYLGIWNERAWSTSYVKLLRSTLNQNGYKDIKIVVADNAESDAPNIISAMQSDPQFAASFDIIGVHYPPSSISTINMSLSDKKLWSSEDSSTNDDAIGGGCWARILNWNYIYGNYTSTIMWPIISSWYEYLPYYGDGLMNVAWSWNDHYEVMSPLWITAHTTQFVNIFNNNWYYIKQGYGSGVLLEGGTYVTFMSSNGETDIINFTIVIETMSYENSLCIRHNPSDNWNVSIQNITFQLEYNNTYILPSKLYVWKSVLFGDDTYLFQQQDDIIINENDFSFNLINVEPNAVITLSTVSNGNKGSYPTPPEKVTFETILPYKDDFQSYSVENVEQPQPKYFSDQAGSFAIVNALKKETGNYAFEQQVLYSPSDNGTQSGLNAPQPLTIIGDYNLTDYRVNVSAFMVSNNNQIKNIGSTSWNVSNIMVAVRLGGSLSTSGCKGHPREYQCVEAIGSNWFNYGYFLQINDNGYWKLMHGVNTTNNNDTKVLIDGNLNIDLQQIWFNVVLSIKGYALSATFNDKPLFENVQDSSQMFASGWAGLACGWQTCQFDDFIMSSV